MLKSELRQQIKTIKRQFTHQQLSELSLPVLSHLRLLLSDAQTLLNQFDNEIGIPTLPAEKKERMITDEANARQADCSARITLWDECLRNSIKTVNKKFGLNIKFNFRTYDVTSDIESDKGDSEKWELQPLQWQG